jgi:hypothetical protein
MAYVLVASLRSVLRIPLHAAAWIGTTRGEHYKLVG